MQIQDQYGNDVIGFVNGSTFYLDLTVGLSESSVNVNDLGNGYYNIETVGGGFTSPGNGLMELGEYGPYTPNDFPVTW